MLEGRVMQQSKAYKKYINRIKDEFVEAENWGERKVDDRQWIIKHLQPIMDEGKKLYEKSQALAVKPVTYDKGYWTGLKLILVKYYVKPYLDILASGEGKKVAYVDLFSGPGLDLIGERKVPVLGSPMIPLVINESKYAFSRFIFSDTNSAYIEALKERIAYFKDMDESIVVLNEDANEVVNKLPSFLDSFDHALVFIDPEGMELTWSSVRSLVDNLQCDLIINFPSAGINRNLHNSQSKTKIQKFLGLDQDIPPEATEEWAIKIYRQNLASIGKDISTEIMVRGQGGFHYHLIPAVRRTKAGSPWFRLFLSAKERIQRLSGEVLRIIADQIEGRQESL
jgi:three-Cys-motif partner protein